MSTGNGNLDPQISVRVIQIPTVLNRCEDWRRESPKDECVVMDIEANRPETLKVR
jgi:hypothetical protein